MLKVEFTGQFKKDYKLALKRGCDPKELEAVVLWQHIGNKKSDSPYPMENTENQNNPCQITYTKLFK